MPNVTYFDENTQNTYIFEVSEEEAKKANKGKNYITYTYTYTYFGHIILCNFKKGNLISRCLFQ